MANRTWLIGCYVGILLIVGEFIWMGVLLNRSIDKMDQTIVHLDHIKAQIDELIRRFPEP